MEMRKLLCCGPLVLAMIAPALAAGDEPGNRPWGEENAGLQCRFKRPDRIEQGMPLEAEIEFRSDPKRLAAGEKWLDAFCHDASMELLMVDLQTKASITIRPYDPTLGMPVSDDGKQVEQLGSPITWRSTFPLATVWSTLKPGTYECRVRYSFPGGYQKSWWRGAPAGWDTIWKGSVVSSPVTIEVLPGRPKTETLLLPKRLRLLPDLKIGYSQEDAEKVEVTLRNGFFVGTTISMGAAGEGSSLQSGTPKPDAVDPIGQLLTYRGGDKRLSYTIVVFETADQVEHEWHPAPGSGNYRELWKRTFDLSLSEKQLRESEQGKGKPVGLRLAGRAEIGGKSHQFEIVMEGFDRYYRKEWAGEQEEGKAQAAGFWMVQLVLGDFGGGKSQSWGEFGSRGGGNYGENGKTEAAVARRLWTGDEFMGVPRGNLRAEIQYGHYLEEFREPVSRDHFPLPCVILWTNNTSSMPQKTTTYTIEKIEFRYKRDATFFEAAKAKYFPKEAVRTKSKLP